MTRAVLACEPNKAVGPDGVPNEVLRRLIEDATSLGALTQWFNHIFVHANPPKEWSHVVLKLLAKVDGPREPAHLRPIALSSHTCKVYAAIVTNRLQDELQPHAHRQLAGKGRRACDFLWTAKTLMALLREWGEPAVVVMLDIRRAFDSLSRIRLAQRIRSWASHKPSEAANIIALLTISEMAIHLPWSSSVVTARQGVRQGAPESPTLFAKVI